MKQLLLLIISFFLITSSILAYSIDEINKDIKYYYSQIDEVKQKQILLNKEKEVLEIKSRNIILETRNQIKINQQQSAMEFHKLGLGVSSGISSQSKAIADKGQRQIDILEAELEYDLSLLQSKIENYGIKILEYKKEIKELEKKKNNTKSLSLDYKKNNMDEYAYALQLKEESTVNNETYKKVKYHFLKDLKRGELWMHNNKPLKSIEAFKEACKPLYDFLDYYQCNYQIGLLNKELGNLEEAKEYFDKALKYSYSSERVNEIENEIQLTNEEIYNKKPEEEKIKDKLSIKADKVFNILETKLSKLELYKKIIIYEKFIIKLNKYKNKSKNEELIILIILLIEKIENYISENNNLETDILKILE